MRPSGRPQASGLRPQAAAGRTGSRFRFSVPCSLFRVAIVAAVLFGPAGAARADSGALGLFAPAEPFPSTAARVELASRLGAALGAGAGKVFARAPDFAAAVRHGQVTLALVDPAYLAAAGGNYTVIAAAVRDGDTRHGWQLVAREAGSIAALRGKRVLVPSVGGREADFVANVLLGGEIGRGYFGAIEAAPDTASALAALGLGKADAAFVPAGVALPAQAKVVLALPAVPGPVLVAYGTVPADRRAQIAAAAAAFHGDPTIAGFRAADDGAVRELAHRFAPVVKRGPFALPAIRLLVGDLVAGRTFSIPRTPATVFAITPPAP